MSNRRIEILSALNQHEKKLLRRYFWYDRKSRLYAAKYGDICEAHKFAMLDMRRTFDVRHTHIRDDGSECPCFSARHRR